MYAEKVKFLEIMSAIQIVITKELGLLTLEWLELLLTVRQRSLRFVQDVYVLEKLQEHNNKKA